jgi:hypothetical protein
MAVSAVQRLIHLHPMPNRTKKHNLAHRLDACAPFQKSKNKLILAL